MKRLLPILILSGYSALAQHPVVTSVSTATPLSGSTVTVVGTGFNATSANNSVYIGGAKASISSSSATSMDVVFPYGASHGPLTVLNLTNGLSGSSASALLPSYNNSGYDATVINLQAKVDFATTGNHVRMAMGDLDGDGKSDIVVVDSANDNIRIFRNTSTTGVITGTTLAAPFSLTTADAPSDVALGDIDGDGKLDIALVNKTSNSISIFHNNSVSGSLSAASFGARVDIVGTNGGPVGISLADWDVDGRVDVAVACSTANIVNVFRNIGSAGSIAATDFAPKVNFTPGTGPCAIVARDIDGDSKVDMCILNNGSNNITVLRNTATSGFIDATTFAGAVVFSTATAPASLYAADMDGDGKSDLVATNSTSNTVSVLRNASATGTVTFATKVDFVAGATPFGVSVGDMNGDGKADLIVSNSNDGTVGIYRNVSTSGSITISSFAPTVTASTASLPKAVAVADVDNDGIPDVVTANASGSISVLRNNPIAQITGTFNVCVGNTTTVSNATAGGVWASSHTAVATINSTGLVTGVSPGTATISYTVGSIATTAVVTVNPLPNAGTLSGTTTVCVAATTTLSSTASGGTWSSSNIAVGTVSTSGVVTGLAAGTTSIVYTATNGCGTATVNAVVTVNALANPGTISGTLVACAGSNASLVASQPGGVWSSGTVAVGTVSSGGTVDGLSAGTTVISYGVTNSCGTQYAVATFTVNPLPAPITGGTDVCVGATLPLASATAGGTWASGNTSIATINTSGVVTGVAPGVVLISYTNAGCTTSTTITVNLVPFAGTLSGASTVCTGATITMSSTAAGGSWSSGTPAVASVDAVSGVVTGVSTGTSTITYTLSNSCGTATANAVVTVQAIPSAGTVSGPVSVCASGSNITLTSSVGSGTWSSSNTLAATVNASGVVTGVDPGTTTISYTVGNVCGSSVATSIVTVNPLPAIITGSSTVCVGTTVTLSSTTGGGSWSSTHTTASIDASGVVTGITPGTTRISYTLVVGCFRTVVLTVNQAPPAISGSPSLCQGATTVLLNAVGGGTWASGDLSVATIVPTTGVVSGISAGTSRITYFRPVTGCPAYVTVTVNVVPTPIVGDTVLCMGASDTFSTSPSGGLWSSSSAGRATVGLTTGIVTGMSQGTVIISYTTAAGCRSTKLVTINQTPQGIGGGLSLCQGSTSTLTNLVPFGVWISSNTTVGIISGSGIIAGVAPGTSTVTYVLSNGCYRSAVVTVNPLPTAISGPSAMCVGTTASFTSTPASGTWLSSDATKASIVSFSGNSSALSAGTVAFSYILPTGCRVYKNVTVNPIPVGISGTASTCVGNTTLLTSSPVTGTWSSSNTAVATIASVAGVVTGVSSGTTVITYMLPATGCYRTMVTTINTLPSAITGTASICSGTSTTLTATPAGGTWSSGATTIATVGFASGIVMGVAAGTAPITYRTSAGCIGFRVLTVNSLASAGLILGTPTFCVGTNVSFFNTSSITTGTWSTVTGNVSITSAGVATGLSDGIDTIKYSVTNMCNSSVARYVVTVEPLPNAGTIGGQDTFCLGRNGTVISSVIGGTWSSDNTTVATVSGGIVTPVSIGTATISYSRSNFCGISAATVNVAVVNPIEAGTISGPDTVCYANSITLTSSATGGEWSSSSPFVSVGSSTGVVTGLAPGVASIRHVVKNECSSDTAYYNVYVKYSIDCPTMVGVDLVQSVFNIFPNPNEGIINIASSEKGNLVLCGVDGKVVARWQIQAGKSSFQFPSEVVGGIYFARFVNEDGVVATQRILYQPR